MRFLVVAAGWVAAFVPGIGGSFASAAQDEAACHGFEPLALTEQQVYRWLGRAVLRIESGQEVGTGYVVDLDRGYVFTAAHVVAATRRNPAVPVEATSPGLVKPVNLLVIMDLTNEIVPEDMALLQADPPGALGHLRPLDVTFREPHEGENYYFMGYPRFQRSPRKFKVQYAGTDDQGRMEVNQAAFDGDSGAPLIDETGAVVAMRTDRLNAVVAVFVHISHARKLLERTGLSTRVAQIDGRVRLGTISAPELAEELRPDPTNASNLELWNWAVHIGRSLQGYAKSRDLFTCPIIPAFAERRLPDAIPLFDGLASSLPLGESLRTVGLRNKQLRNSAAAYASLSEARAHLRRAIEETIERQPSGIRYALCQSGDVQRAQAGAEPKPGQKTRIELGEGGWLRADVPRFTQDKPAFCQFAEADPKLASMFIHYAEVNNHLGDLVEGSAAQAFWEEARFSASVAYWTAAPRQQQVSSLLALGGTYNRMEAYKEAAAAFAEVLAMGDASPDVEEAFVKAADAAGKRDPDFHAAYSRYPRGGGDATSLSRVARVKPTW